MLKKTLAGAALMAAAFAISSPPALANVASGTTAMKAQAGSSSAVQPVFYRRGFVGRPYGWGHRRWAGGWARPYVYGGYYPGYYGGYGGWGYPAGYGWGYGGWGGYGWGPGVSVGIAPGFGIGFGF